MFILGIDAGQTSTKSCLYNHEDGTYILSKGPSIDHMLTDKGQLKSKLGIQQSIKNLLNQTTQRIEEVKFAFVSISGIHKEHESLVASWILECINVEHFIIEGDVKANLAGASSGNKDGILVIAGGGSIAYCFNGNKEYVAGGYGHILGDEGSAYWIGLQAIKEAIKHTEYRGSPTKLADEILHTFNEDSFWGIKKKIHGNYIDQSDVANLSVLVEKLANLGDTVSQNILKAAGSELGELVVSIIKQLENDGIYEDVNKVYPTGGVFNSQVWVLTSMKQKVEEYRSSIQICSPAYPPIIGTIILAGEFLNIDIKFNRIKSLIEEIKYEHKR
ncbi:N-acetylglucosamine kinase-like BadF-type ATPase [Bacillus oleivorans]|uniref:N-acetylglucosamine kinase-like BadF-type ATPase n=1 Tax=Bacillus oleivorans TaxID=1448271 RepID=A0A285CHY1_9BACI|nr:BadF/BadG/BcrA/BcrD ATPase family protein [Bacillus oleivorans]SNX67120.1 N-acetylglucosamine kinase-like BadF-type ATPase [Bacillus oleivorans]